MSDFLFYGGVVSFLLGVSLASVLTISLSTTSLVGLVGVTWGILAWRFVGSEYSRVVRYGAVFLLLATIGLACTQWYEARLAAPELAPYLGAEVTFTGVVAAEPQVRSRSQHLYVDTTNGTILVLADRASSYQYGDAVAVTGTLQRPEAFVTDLGRTFDYPQYLAAQGVTHMVQYASVEVTGIATPWHPVRLLLQAKQRFVAVLTQTLPEPAAGLGLGLLLGVKSALGDSLETAFRQTGIIHIVVLSGYNIALVVAFVLFGLSYVLPFRARLIVAALAVLGFALIVGLSATVVRASVMAGFLLLAQLLGRSYQVLRGLCLAGVIMILINPYLLLHDVGFQLSFLATFGLLILVPKFEITFTRLPAAWGLRSILFATIATQLVVLPLLLYQIGEFSLVSVVVNVLVLPMVPVAMLLTFLTGLIGLVSEPIALLVGRAALGSLQYIIYLAEFFAALPFSAFVVPAFSLMVMLSVYAAAALFWWYYALSRALPVTPQRSTVPSLSGWVIEDEAVVLERIAKY